MTTLNILQSLKDIDISMLLTINGANNSFFDSVMYTITNKFTWIPLYLLLLWLSWKYYGKQALWVIIAIILSVIIADLVSVHLFKNVFQRYRPCHNIDLQGLLHLVNGKCGGKYGFISSHACNTAAVATSTIFFFGKKFKWMIIVMILYALLNSYSRVYLGVHYPSDVLGGIVVGSLLGLGISALTLWMKRTFTKHPL